MIKILSRQEFAFFYSCAFVGCLFVSFLFTWWIILIGGSPPKVEYSAITYQDGSVGTRFSPGQLAFAHHRVCADRETTIQIFPSIDLPQSGKFALKSSLVQTINGCKDAVQIFSVPDLPPGNYTLSTVFKFQNNLVGRDEFSAFPSVSLRITR